MNFPATKTMEGVFDIHFYHQGDKYTYRVENQIQGQGHGPNLVGSEASFCFWIRIEWTQEAENKSLGCLGRQMSW
jgi:hypothetical protein